MLNRLVRSNTDETLTRGRALTITAFSVVIVFLLWNVDVLSPIAYPFRLFVTYVHEAGHSLMALLTGGEVVGFSVSSDGSGLARTVGGVRALILPAGYLGAATFGALLFFILNTRPYARTISVILGVALVGFTLLYAQPDPNGQPIALVVGLVTGGVLVFMGLRATPTINLLVLNVLAMMTALNAVLDVYLLIRYSDITMRTNDGRIVHNDASAFSAEVLALPASFWALLWSAIAVLMMGAAVYYSIIRPILRGDNREPALEYEDYDDSSDEIDFSQFV